MSYERIVIYLSNEWIEPKLYDVYSLFHLFIKTIPITLQSPPNSLRC